MAGLSPLRIIVISLAFAVIVTSGAIFYEMGRPEGSNPLHLAASLGAPADRPTATPSATAPAVSRHVGILTPRHAVATVKPTARPTRAATATPRPPATPTRTATARPSATSTTAPRPTRTPTIPAPPTDTATPADTATPRDTPTPVDTATPVIPLVLGAAQFSLFTINPDFMRQRVSFTLSKPAHVVVAIRSEGTVKPVRTFALRIHRAGTTTISWNGRTNHGALVPEGQYSYLITATDGSGVQASESYDYLGITYKRMVVSLSKQQLTAYDGHTVFLTTLVTTGNAALPTPLGVFPVLARYHPFTMISPWPVGSQFYYAPSPVNYALLFDNRGYYVHDAPWRGVFGPGSNAQVGTPGDNYTGTHGCVNVPLPAEEQLYNWSTIGTIVQVVP